MATIVTRPRASGGKAYMAKIVLKRGGVIVHRESKTHETRAAAVSWAKRREIELSDPKALAAAASEHTLADAIDKYTTTSIRQIGRTKAQVLRSIKNYKIAQKRCSAIKSPDIVEFATLLHEEGREPSTVGNYMSHLSALFRIARPAWGYALDADEMDDAFKVLARLGTTGKSRQRERRPTLDELDRLLTYFEATQQRRPGSMPMPKLILFALFSTRRQEEITRIRWADRDDDRILVRDMKHPGQKIGNDVWCKLPAEAAKIIGTMKHKRDEIFPYNHRSISANFTRACKVLGIEDLHFHDLRHEGVSRLFEIGKTIPEAASVSGHQSWSSLKRYTHLRQTGDKYAGWHWLDRVTS